MGQRIKIGEFMAEVWHDEIYTSKEPDLRQELYIEPDGSFCLVQHWPEGHPGPKVTREDVLPAELPELFQIIENQEV